GTTLSRCGTTSPGAGQLPPVRDNFPRCGTTSPGAEFTRLEIIFKYLLLGKGDSRFFKPNSPIDD
ncbi:MAG TPA: hypothetical protein VK186_24725, partial [Candidatus Deferrimicrobium sp.]|nr:hypothetical protein [Candidatus Deferrimicrobium sp.]